MSQTDKSVVVRQAGIVEDTQIIFRGNPVWLQGMRGKVIRVSSMQPEVVTVLLENLQTLVTDIFQLEVVDEVQDYS